MVIKLKIGHDQCELDKGVFQLLFDNSVARNYKAYGSAMSEGRLRYEALLDLCRVGDIPFPLVFAPLAFVEAQVKAKEEKLLQGVSKETFQVGTRGNVILSDVELIIKDLMRKQELLKKHDSSLKKNDILGFLAKKGSSAEADAVRLKERLGLNTEDLLNARNKSQALEMLISCLEANQILVSQSVQNYMMQRLSGLKFSGITIRDNKVPYIFLRGGNYDDGQEPVGRRIFSLTLLTVLVARRIFSPVVWDGRGTEIGPGYEYDVAGAMLMPSELLRGYDLSDLEEVKIAADYLKVTPSAVAVRGMRLSEISGDTARRHLEQLQEEGARKVIQSGGGQIKPENAVKKYAGRELTRRMLIALQEKKIGAKEFCRTVCLNKLGPAEIPDLWGAVK